MSKAARIDPFAPIVPDYGLGGLFLRQRALELQDLLCEATRHEVVGVFEVRYHFGEVSLSIDVRSGRVFKLIANNGYRGLLRDKIRVGMVVREAMLAEPLLYYDEMEEALYVRDTTGVCIDVPEQLPDPSLVPECRIQAIAVFAHEILTAAGQAGQL